MTLPTAQQLTDILRRNGHLQSGEVAIVEPGERFTAAADELCRLHLRYSPGGDVSAPPTLIYKRYGPQWYAMHGQPEANFYRHLATHMPHLPVVASYGLVDDPAEQTLFVLLEDLTVDYQAAHLPVSQAQLELVTDTLVRLHADWWQHPLLHSGHLLTPDASVCRMPQALGADGIAAHAAVAAAATQRFLHNHAHELLPNEQSLLLALGQEWGTRFAQRVADGMGITLIHGDFHLLGNIFFAKASTTQPPLKIIDWAQSKRALGVHDLMYMLLSVEAENRVERDLVLLRRYHTGLLEAGVTNYSWQQCLWDYQFSQLTNLFQSLLQDSLRWFRRTYEVIETWQSARLLEEGQKSEVSSQ